MLISIEEWVLGTEARTKVLGMSLVLAGHEPLLEEVFMCKAWKKKGSMGIPPGLQEGPTKPIGLREYTAKQTGYLLRPEVR